MDESSEIVWPYLRAFRWGHRRYKDSLDSRYCDSQIRWVGLLDSSAGDEEVMRIKLEVYGNSYRDEILCLGIIVCMGFIASCHILPWDLEQRI